MNEMTLLSEKNIFGENNLEILNRINREAKIMDLDTIGQNLIL